VISFAIVGDPNRVPDKIKNMIPAIQARSLEAMKLSVIELTARVKEKLSDDVLHVRTGTLRRSITGKVSESGTQVIGTVGTNIVYARINEFGGKTPPHDIYPRNAQALAWPGQGVNASAFMKKGGGFTKRGGVSLGQSGSLVFAKVVHHPGSKIPARSYLRSSLKELEPQIMARFKNAVAEVISK
jgi:phage gpG-like protein